MDLVDRGDVGMVLHAGLSDPEPMVAYLWLQDIVKGALGIELRSGRDDERGTYVEFEQTRERGLVDCEVVDNRGNDPRHWKRLDRQAVVEMSLRGPLLDLGRVAQHLAGANPRAALQLMTWGVLRPWQRDQHWMNVGGDYAVGDDGTPAWLVPVTGAPGAVAAATWRCQLVAAVGARPVSDVPALLAGLVRAPWQDGDGGDDVLAAAASPFELSATAQPNQRGSRPAIVAARPADDVIVQVSWLATSLVEPGWLAALLEQRGFAIVEYRVAGTFVDDGLMRMLIGDGSSHVALHAIDPLDEAPEDE
jgi:hypothetical protein